MSPRERLKRYFELSRRKSQLSSDEFHEWVHLEEALIADFDRLTIPDELYKLQWRFIYAAIELFCGPYAVMDTGSSWDVMAVLLDKALPKLTVKERMKIADMVSGKVAVSCDNRREYANKFKKR